MKNQDYDLLQAINYNDLKLIKELLKNGADINTKTIRTGHAVLHLVVVEENLELVNLLLNEGADFGVRCKKGDTPLHLAVADFIEKSRKGKDSSCFVDTNTNLRIIKSLIDKGADINMSNNDGETPLYLAKEAKNLIVLKLLMKWSNKQNQDSKELGLQL